MRDTTTLKVALRIVSLLLLLGLNRQGNAIGFYFDTTLGVGGGPTKYSTDAGSPLIGSTTVGVTVGMLIFKERLLLGFGADYRFCTQWNESPTGTSNYRGSALNLLSPTIGFTYKRILIKLDYKFMGSYSLKNPTISGQFMSYGSPMGFRGEVIFRWKPAIGIGLFVDSTSYSTRTLDSEPQTVTGSLSHLQAGFVITLIFDPAGRKYASTKLGGKKY